MTEADPGTSNLVRAARVDRSAYSFGSLTDDTELEYWLARSPHERFAAGKLLRQIDHGDSAITGRLQTVLEIA